MRILTFLSCVSLLMLTVAAHAQSQTNVGAQIGRIQIVDESRAYEASEPRKDIGRPFNQSRPCSGNRPATTISELLGSDVKAIHVLRYDKAVWSNMTVVTRHLHRIMAGQPETGELLRHIHWAEGRPVEIEGRVEFASGRTSRIEFANGYAHVEDDSGCEWWGRYLGESNTRIVR